MKKGSPSASRILAVSIVTLISSLAPSWAVPLTWDSDANFATGVTDGSGTWDTATTQWNNGTSNVVWDNLTNEVAIFGDGAAGGATPATVTLGVPITAGGISFRTSSVTSGYTLAGANLVLGGATPTIDAMVGTNSTINSILEGTAGLVLTGGGAVTLTAFNTYTGGTVVNGGNLILTGTNNATGIIRGALTINAGARVTTTTANAFGYNANRVSTLNINGGLLDDTAAGDQGWALTVNLNGGTMQTNGGVSSTAATQLFALGGGSAINSLPNAVTSTIAGRVNLRETNPNNQLTFNVADGDAAVDLLVSAAITASAATHGIVKTGAGTMELSGQGTFAGNVSIDGGTLIASRNAALGANNGTRTITLNNPGTVMNWTINNVFVGGGSSAAALPILTLNPGTTLNATRYNAIGNITLNGATLNQNASDAGNYEGYQFLGTVTVGGTAPSTISSGNAKANHLRGAATTIFDVADVTSSPAADLIVSNPIRDGSGDYGGIGALQKNGAGTMVLTAQNPYTGTTTVSAGTLALSGAGSLASTNVVVSPGATFDVSGLTLGKFSLATGQTLTVGRATSPGLDVVGNLESSLGSINIAGTGTAGTFVMGGDLALGGGSLKFDLSNVTTTGAGVNDLVVVTNNLSLTGTTEIVINKSAGALTASGTYTLFQYTGVLTGGVSNLILSGAAGGTTRQIFSLDSTTTAGSVLLNVAGTVANLLWAGGAPVNNTWDVNTTASWTGAPDSKFFDGDTVTFNDSGFAGMPVTVNGPVQPASLTVDNSTKDYTFSGGGSIGGIGGLTKNGTGKLSVSLANTFTGPVNVNNGTLSVATAADNGQASGLGAGTQLTLGSATTNGTLQFTGATGTTNRNLLLNAGGGTIDVPDALSALTLSGPVTGTGNLVKNGVGSLAITGIIDTTGAVILNDGTLTLSRLNTYTGGTTINGGTLALTFGGIAGAVRGVLTVNAAGTVIDSVKDALGYGPNRVTTLNINGGVYRHTSANNVTLWGMSINMTGGLLDSPDPVSTIDVGTSADAGNVPTIINTFASPDQATISGNGLNLRQANTVFTVADGDAFADLVITAPIIQGVAGSGITKAGPGTMRLNAINTYAGATNVQEGTLVVAGSVTGSAFTVNSGAVLSGGGVVGAVNVLDNGILSPGEFVGTLTTGDLILNQASKLSFDLGLAGVVGGIENDLLQVGGGLTLDGVLQVLPQFGFGGGTYLLISYSGLLANNKLELDPTFLALYPGSYVDAGTTGSVNLVVVPEPGSAALLLGGLGLLGAFRRRRS